jgi:murein DD-endopeptidase MepM/ murein hydrolase activator NlpD
VRTTAAYAEDPVDPRWRFFTTDRTRYTSAWFEGAHRVMIGFGCTAAPYYAHDPRCPANQGFHHGIDVVMPCGTPLTSAVDGVVAPANGPGRPDAAYGAYAFRIRVASAGVDILLGHVRTVSVRPGQAVVRGQRNALSADEGAPDGCHLHVEVRSVAGGLATARDPLPLLGLHPAR